MAIGKRAGVVVKKVLRGPDSLGNVQDRQIKASAGSYRHTEKDCQVHRQVHHQRFDL